MRRIPEHRFDDLIDAATEVFIERGYRRTQMADIADAVGVAKGTIYGYVESKEALFALCLRWASRTGPVERPQVLPFPTPPPGRLSQRLKENLAAEAVPARLAAALERERADDPRAELDGVLRELYELNERNRRSIKLLDRCHDHPELQGLWQQAGREGSRLAMRRYLELRVAAGQLRDVPSPQLAARIVIETVATWAIHIHWDRAPEAFDPDEARENAIDFLIRGLLP
ncbi:MAG: TetR/AcrR family transcriptional regulator [Deltaproteobacteria bacterium]|nr:TetR/AcrR family transcriptional regulator [Deltaproteobacteria bacterium]MBW2446162.1 TetR/AcrR family transcriptional regulator [Deltaproteobacteria bacterium]